MTSKFVCPNCGSDHVDRDEVDIGVGVQCGPWGCFDCGWTEGADADRALAEAEAEAFERWQSEGGQ